MGSANVYWDVKEAVYRSSETSWQHELWEMRGRVLYAGGRRPHFRLPDGSFSDPDPLDCFSYQILARDDHKLIGSCRVIPLRAVRNSSVETLLGADRFKRFIDATGLSRDSIGEVGRWVVVPERAGQYLGLRFIAGTWAVARALGLKGVIAFAGTRNGQAKSLVRTGAHIIAEIPPIHSSTYDDDLVPVFANLARPSYSFEKLIQEMNSYLKVERLSASGGA